MNKIKLSIFCNNVTRRPYVAAPFPICKYGMKLDIEQMFRFDKVVGAYKKVHVVFISTKESIATSTKSTYATRQTGGWLLAESFVNICQRMGWFEEAMQ